MHHRNLPRPITLHFLAWAMALKNLERKNEAAILHQLNHQKQKFQNLEKYLVKSYSSSIDLHWMKMLDFSMFNY